MRKFLFYVITTLMSSCTVYNGSTVDDLYHSGLRDRQVYLDPDRGYIRMRTTSNKWRTFDEDFYYWNFGPGLVGVGNPMSGWNTWRWYSPGFPVYGSAAYPWHGTSPWVPYSIYGTWGWDGWSRYPNLGNIVIINNNTWNPYNSQSGINSRHTTGPRRFNLGAYNVGQGSTIQSPARTSSRYQPTYQPRTSTQSGATSDAARNGSPNRTFSAQQSTQQPRTPTQVQTRPGSAPVRKFDRP